VSQAEKEGLRPGAQRLALKARHAAAAFEDAAVSAVQEAPVIFSELIGHRRPEVSLADAQTAASLDPEGKPLNS
jgi:hypothetical protein